MPWAKRTKLIAILIFFAVFFLTRIPLLGSDVINPDAVNWHFRSEQFVVGLKSAQFEKTYQHYHPGVTLMWIMGPTIEIIRQFFPEYRVYDNSNFILMHTSAKIALVVVQFVLSLLLIAVLAKILDFKKAYFSVFLLSLEPFFIGNSRLIHLDVLLTLFLILGLSLIFLALRNSQNTKTHLFYIVLGSIFLALAFLTKSIGIGAILFVLGFGIVHFILSKQFKKLVIYVGALIIPYISTIGLIFPSMWVQPIFTLTEILSEGERVGIRKGHHQIFFNSYTRDPGIFFYPIVLKMKMSPFILAGFGLYVVHIIFRYYRALKQNSQSVIKRTLALSKRVFVDLVGEDKFVIYLSIFYFGYFLIMTYPSKKIDRYMIPMFAYFAIVSIIGYFKFEELFKQKIYKILLIILFVLSIVVPLGTFFPYYFTYTSPFYINANVANQVVGQKPFGVGMVELRDHIIKNYGKVDLGFIDTKPMRTIYSNSQISDIRVSGTSDYDLLILGPNEEMPEKVLESDNVFILDSVVKINGLDYWRIYVKEDK